MAKSEGNNVGGEEECELTANLRNEFVMSWEQGRVGSEGPRERGPLHQTTVIFDTGFLTSQFFENRVSD